MEIPEKYNKKLILHFDVNKTVIFWDSIKKKTKEKQVK